MVMDGLQTHGLLTGWQGSCLLFTLPCPAFGMTTLTDYASWCGHNNFAMHSKTVGSSVHSFSTTAGYEAAEHNLEKQSNLAEKAQASIVRFASFSAHCRRRCAARDLSDALRAQAAVGRENKHFQRYQASKHSESLELFAHPLLSTNCISLVGGPPLQFCGIVI